MKQLLCIMMTTLTAASSFALNISCVDRDFQDSQITARFTGTQTVKVTLGIPTGPTSLEDAHGECVIEEDASSLSFRCENVRTRAGATYFARIDGDTATVAKNGRILTHIPCRTSN